MSESHSIDNIERRLAERSLRDWASAIVLLRRELLQRSDSVRLCRATSPSDRAGRRWPCVYLMLADSGECKIGYSACPGRRLELLIRSERKRIQLHAQFPTLVPWKLETELHRYFRDYRSRPKSREWFVLCPTDVKGFCGTAERLETAALDREADEVQHELRFYSRCVNSCTRKALLGGTHVREFDVVATLKGNIMLL